MTHCWEGGAGVFGMVGVVGLWGWQGGGQLGLDVLWVLQVSWVFGVNWLTYGFKPAKIRLLSIS